MVRRVLLIALLLTIAWLLPASAWSADIHEAVEATNQALIAAFERGDSHAVSLLYTEDAKVIPPGSETASGRSMIAAYWQSGIDAGTRILKLNTHEVEAAGDFAYEVGTLRLAGVDGSVTVSRYVVVWKREIGKWKLHRDIWN